MFAELVDFRLKMNDKDEILGWYFRWNMRCCEDFRRSLNQLKISIPFQHRMYYQDRAHLWYIENTPSNLTAMEEVFDNFRNCYELASSQLRLL